jgi:hypothetical protein
MRVRISYSVDLEDVPEECARMLQDSLEHVGELHTQIEDLIDQLDKGQCVGWVAKLKIAECRERLGKLDVILGDNDMILEGYYTAKEPKEEVEDVSDQG